jgi:CheY-specific phosphatase CheX
MTETLDHPLKTVGQKILEDWAMMITEEVDESECHFNPDEKLYMAWISVEGCVRGALSVVAQLDFIQTLTSNLLGTSANETPTPAECEDAMREMGNVLAGHYFTAAFGEDVVFDLINPTVSEVPFSELEKMASRRVKYYFHADDTPVAITFSIKE